MGRQRKAFVAPLTSDRTTLCWSVGWSDEAEEVVNLSECVSPGDEVKRLNDFA